MQDRDAHQFRALGLHDSTSIVLYQRRLQFSIKSFNAALQRSVKMAVIHFLIDKFVSIQ